METIECRLTVFFDAPFWVGIAERVSDGRLTVCKRTFGAEPRDAEVYEWVLKDWNRLPFGPPIAAEDRREVRVNPKRMQREAKRQVAAQGAGTRSQQALQLQREENKRSREQRSRREREAEAQRKFDLRQQRRREKHKGR